MIFRKEDSEMKISSFFYSLGQGFKNIGRNKVFFLASVATIAACIFMIGMFLSIIMNFNHILDEAKESVCITVFFDKGMDEDEIQQIGSQFSSWEEVSSVEYTSAEQAWQDYKDKYFKDYPEMAEGFADDNPLADSASYSVYLKDLGDQTEVVARIEAIDGVRQVNKSEVTAGALSDFGTIAGIVSLAIIIVLLAVSIFLISNTIVTGITMHKEEIHIMKYVGATDFFVKSPYVFEGIIIGIIGAVIPLVILFFIYKKAISYIVTQMQTITSVFTFLPLQNVFAYLIPLSLIIGAGIGFIGSMIATSKHIRV